MSLPALGVCFVLCLSFLSAAAVAQTPVPDTPAAVPRVRQQMHLTFAEEGTGVQRTIGWYRPAYPAKARRLLQEGTVTLRIEMDPAGEHRVEIAQSSGWPMLDQSALEAMSGLAIDDGPPLLRRTRFRLPVRFVLAPPPPAP
ncbi:energy transducer TonB [Bordetella genomosp. 12]|uniref:Energy transducer TonB n=1 Tax=Bordetella genomosp. 12 TaxID=463035 RepID=A0A261VL02_9BORD|nr:energy transducer TonB [Bordetella genomosp. 12]OZI74818.1 energy transducer TonB [Bordetella genomosp. 12]